MIERPEPKKLRKEFALFHLVPNMLTVAAICAGLTAIRLGVHGAYLEAVLLILAAAVLDGLDGRLARLMGSDSRMGAELDSLADFLNFGIATPLLLYFWALQDAGGAGWLSVLIFAVCAVMRLARFNVAGKSDIPADEDSKKYFVGVPSPAGALMSMMPMYVSFAFTDAPLLPDALIGAWMIAMGLLMISRVPTWSFKATRISRENVKFFLVGFAALCAALLTFAWVALTALCLIYAGAVTWTLVDDRLKKKRGH
ncbi:CDP-diacylglycerol---serine O-phosphatidyltransferase [Tranquillimonas rosea]|uniref:CDP-diacylglycerol---serine O-phosphatidyltransferase n=1 Tax=Tranquillimonas rosea TaxID=641238 RepID=A0A1H9V6Q5_9RHOB|nr:phosphatidylcholine/phosphatidylserine synthase [Tranquillimonas rosea]SES16933.1 CDP-diacylglycerol---serine O-phosphatidyltransferase [Tranquillimonas rosea]